MPLDKNRAVNVILDEGDLGCRVITATCVPYSFLIYKQ